MLLILVEYLALAGLMNLKFNYLTGYVIFYGVYPNAIGYCSGKNDLIILHKSFFSLTVTFQYKSNIILDESYLLSY